ncbi:MULTISPECIES: 2-oxoacid:acceptor oxidoreductase subunit alpha [unclassified Archaeoglobus]|jgi:2-oxoglutarate ferredoxin oxidoreductase subunit alpha|uniref:2-oxoacid:acceptor oxidoreductase subunit alpha n=1 Tax=unclassified Archaeoglobus TaxID=2643606 RepID=UPI0025BAE730|nr:MULTISPECIES: 2-oxoacid:acceptor oxidoreductase subunit alpha [unclassified Archaeoglobus]
MLDFNFCIAGAAGDGVKEAGEILAELLSNIGYSVFVYQEYESLIRGGHNASVVRCSDKRIHSHRYYYDAMICLEDYVIDIHKQRLRGFLIHDSKFECDFQPSFSVPMLEIVREAGMPKLFRNAAALGALCYILGIDFEELARTFVAKYGDKAEKDVEIAKKAYEHSMENYKRVLNLPNVSGDGRRRVVSGSEAIAMGMVSAGLSHYYAYPMTPASPILHFLAKSKLIIAVQPENEIAAIMMAIGSAFAGKRSAVGTSGGGFALMSESISLAGMAEIPLLIVLAQRSGPSTGMATFTAQEDLYFALNPAHGEFPLIVASPLTIGDAFSLSATLLNLAWCFQTPAILLTEKHLTESYESVEFDEDEGMEEIEIFNSETDEIFPRYEITNSGISRYAIPPAVVKANSNEHDEFGITIDDADVARRMYAKRMRKEKAIKKKVERLNPYIFAGKGKDIVVTWGSNFGAVIEAAEELGYSVVGIRFLRPLILPKFKGEVMCVECNYTGLLAEMIEKGTGVRVRRILRWDGRPFTPEEVKHALTKEVRD